jgi:hypothetical protein
LCARRGPLLDYTFSLVRWINWRRKEGGKPVATDGDAGARALGHDPVHQSSHIANVLLAGAAGKEVVCQSGRVFNALEGEVVAVGTETVETGFEIGAEGTLDLMC